MDSNLTNISSIETFFDSILKDKISKNLFFNNLPKTISKTWSEMVVVDVGNFIQDMDAYGEGVVNVFLYAKPMADGRKSVAKLSKMEKSLCDVIQKSENKHYVLSKLNSYSDYDDIRNLHCNIVSVKLLII